MMCDKVGYSSYQEVISAINGIVRDGSRAKFKSYKCKECGMFHIATEGKRHKIRRLPKGPTQTRFRINKSGKAAKNNNVAHYAPPTENKIISKEMAEHLKRLINGNNNMYKK